MERNDYVRMTNLETMKVNLVAVKAAEANESLEGLAKANVPYATRFINCGEKVYAEHNGKTVFMTELIKGQEEDEFDGILPGDLVT